MQLCCKCHLPVLKLPAMKTAAAATVDLPANAEAPPSDSPCRCAHFIGGALRMRE
jgi:hypothetical protein